MSISQTQERGVYINRGDPRIRWIVPAVNGGVWSSLALIPLFLLPIALTIARSTPMTYALLADLIVLLHLLFVLFVVLGGLLVLRYQWVAWLHVPAAVWGAVVELAGWICPLTPWEVSFRLRAGEVGYETGFIDHYLMPLIYPAGLTRQLQIAIGAFVVALNLVVYLWVWYRRVDRSNQP